MLNQVGHNMKEEFAASILFANAVAALAEIEGMKALNMQRQVVGSSMAYDDNAFFNVIEKYGIHHNAIYTLYNKIPG